MAEFYTFGYAQGRLSFVIPSGCDFFTQENLTGNGGVPHVGRNAV